MICIRTCVHVPMLASYSLYKSSLCCSCVRTAYVRVLCQGPGGSERDDDTTCAVCAWTMLADSDTLTLVLCALLMCYLQVRHPVRDWRKLGKCQKVIQHRPEGGVAVNSEGLLAVTDIMITDVFIILGKKVHW